MSCIKFISTYYEIALRWMPQDFTDGESTLVQVMAWCHQATSHYLSQCWTRSMASIGHNELSVTKGPIHYKHVNGLMQDCSVSSALAVEILQSCHCCSLSRVIPIVEMAWSYYHLISIMEIPVLMRQALYIELSPLRPVSIPPKSADNNQAICMPMNTSFRTANMSWRMCVVAKQIQSNEYQFVTCPFTSVFFFFAGKMRRQSMLF